MCDAYVVYVLVRARTMHIAAMYYWLEIGANNVAYYKLKLQSLTKIALLIVILIVKHGWKAHPHYLYS